MTSHSQVMTKAAGIGRGLRTAAAFLVCLVVSNGIGRAKEAGLTAIEILDGPGGAAYVQLTNVLVSGKIEMRVAGTSDTPINHDSYDKLNQIAMSAGGMLERGADGVLRYTGTDGKTVIVVPMNAKYVRGASLTPAELADQAVLQGEPAQNVQQIGPGVKLVFVVEPDQELAEYLLAVRASDIAGWQAYLQKYPAAKHVGDARSAWPGSMRKPGRRRSTATPGPRHHPRRTIAASNWLGRSRSRLWRQLPTRRK